MNTPAAPSSSQPQSAPSGANTDSAKLNSGLEKITTKLEEIKESSCKILLQIHDELIFEVHKDDIKKYSQIIQEEMSSVKSSDLHSFSIPLLVDVNAGNDWGDLH